MIPAADSAISPYAGFDIPQLLRLRAATRADHPFLIWEPFEGEGERLTYAAFEHRVRQCAAGLTARGVKPGDPVLIHLENAPEMLVAWFACAYVGGIAVTTNARASADELAYFASHSGAVAAITQPRFAELVNASSRDLKWMSVIDHDSGAPAAKVPPKAEGFSALLATPILHRACRPTLRGRSGAVHIRHDIPTQRRALDACQCALGCADQCDSRGFAR